MVHDAVEQGYTVRAVVRDKSRADKVDHILAINALGFPGHVELFEADLGDVGRCVRSQGIDRCFSVSFGLILGGKMAQLR